MRTLPLHLLFVLFLAACSPGATQVFPTPAGPFLDQRPAVIFVHGYYGSALADVQTGEREFARPFQALFQKLPIALDAEALGARPSPDLRVEGVYGSVVVIPFLYDMPAYTPLLESLRRDSSVQVIPFAYDWRKDLTTAVKDLDALIKKLKAAGVPRITLFAHSMGGTAVSYYLGYGTQPPATAILNWEGAAQVHKALFFGTPFRGVMSIVRNMQNGTGYPWNTRFLEPETVASFPASYSLVPFTEEGFVGDEGAYIPLDLTQISTWREWQLGYFHQKDATPAVEKHREEFTKKELAASVRWNQLLQFKGKAPPATLRVLNVIGSGTRTLAKGFANFPTHEILFRKEDLKKIGKDLSLLEEDGDGTVPASCAELPDALAEKARVLHTTRTHGELFFDPKVEKEYAQFLAEP